MKKLLVILLAALMLCSCTVSQRTDPASTEEPETTRASTEDLENTVDRYIVANGKKLYPEYVLEVNGRKISFAEFRYNYLNEVYAMTKSLSADALKTFWTDEKEELCLQNAIKSIVIDQAMPEYALNNNFALNAIQEKQIDDDLQTYIDQYGKGKFDQMLDTYYCLDIATFRDFNCRSYVLELIFNDMYKDDDPYLAWDDAKFESYCQEKLKMSFTDYADKNYLRAKHILILFESGENTESHEKTLEKINAVYEKLQNGEDFDALVKEYNEDPGVATNPDGYVFKEGVMVDEFYKGTLALDFNSYSEPVMTTYGFHIILRLPLRDVDREIVKEEVLFGTNSNGAYFEEFGKFVEAQKASYDPTVVFNPELEGLIKHDTVK